MNTTDWLKTFFEEKALEYVDWELESNNGEMNFISNEVVIEHIMIAPEHEKRSIQSVLRKIDFVNGNVNDFLKHLAGALINA